MNEAPRVDGRKLRYAHRRDELLAASAGYVLEHGLATLSLRPLGKAIGIAPSALVHHFGTKEQLVTEVLGFIRDRSLLDEPGAGAGDGLEGYAQFWRRWDDAAALPLLRLTYEVIGLAIHSPEKFVDFRAHLIADWLVVVEAQLRVAGCPAGELEALATSLIAHMAGLQLDLLLTGDRERTDAAHESFLRMLDERRRHWATA